VRARAASALARSLRTIRARVLAARAAERRGLCLDFCRSGECAAARAGRCPHAHEPAKVAVCARWLAGACAAGAACKLQHRVLPELMPVCTFYLQVCGCGGRG
jgi:hypothetical protein